MNVVLKNSRKIIGMWVQPISIEKGIPLPHKLGAPAYRYGDLVRWEPVGPPPSPQGERVKVPFWCNRDQKGEIEMDIEEDDESLFRAHPLFRASAGR